MKNTIYKTYAKKILKSEAFVSVMIVFVLALGIIGTSYSLYMDIDTDTDYQLVEVGDLSIGFNNGSNQISLENMTPTSDDVATGKVDSDLSREIASKNLTSFYIYNTGTYTAHYDIKLVVTDRNTVDTNSIKYQICRDNAQNCKDIAILGQQENSIIYKDELTPNSTALDTNNTSPSAYYFLRVWIDENYTITEAQIIDLKIVIEAKNASGYLDNKNTLAGAILNNPNITINNIVPDFSSIADYKVTGDKNSGELGMFKAEDDYGISYYFRGAQSNNYVTFSNKCWRIVRIQGDGSIKLLLESQQPCSETAPSDFSIGNSEWGSIHEKTNDNFIANYMGSETGLKNTLLNWFNEINETGERVNITLSSEKLIKTEEWCLGNVINAYKYDNSQELLGTISEENKASQTPFYYETARNLSGLSSDVNPTLKCNGETDSSKIGTITADETVFAGGKVGEANKNYYLKNGSYYYWTLSLSHFNDSRDFAFYINNQGALTMSKNDKYGTVYNHRDMRPAIILNADVRVISGEGTKVNSYIINEQ